MSEYQMLRTYLEMVFGNVIDRAVRDERGVTAEAIVIMGASLLGAAAVAVVLWGKLEGWRRERQRPSASRALAPPGHGTRPVLRRVVRDERGTAATHSAVPRVRRGDVHVHPGVDVAARTADGRVGRRSRRQRRGAVRVVTRDCPSRGGGRSAGGRDCARCACPSPEASTRRWSGSPERRQESSSVRRQRCRPVRLHPRNGSSREHADDTRGATSGGAATSRR